MFSPINRVVHRYAVHREMRGFHMPEPSAGSITNKTAPRTVADVLSDMDYEIRSGQALDLVPISTHFDPLDSVLGGGVRAGDLVLVGGRPGVGKPIVTFQWDRHTA